jgi:hypothetical protein
MLASVLDVARPAAATRAHTPAALRELDRVAAEMELVRPRRRCQFAAGHRRSGSEKVT